MSAKRVCSFPGCGRRHVAHGLCCTHRAQMKSRGTLAPVGERANKPVKRPLRERFEEKIDRNGPVIRPELGPCWSWLGAIDDHGYAAFNVNGRKVHGSRVSWELENGPIPPGMCVCHRCDNPPCCNPAHLFLGTQQDNLRDMREKGRFKHNAPRGESNGHASLTEAQAREIIAARARGEKISTLAKRYAVGETAVGHLISGRTWKCLGIPRRLAAGVA